MGPSAYRCQSCSPRHDSLACNERIRAFQYNPPLRMQKILLLYNPLSGRRQDRRLADVEAITKIFQNAGASVSASRTGSSSEAARQASEAAANGFDTIFACGGDGTIHDVLQGIVGTNAVLGII